MATAKWAQAACQESRGSTDPEVDREVWSTILEEAQPDKGWLAGPLTADEVTAKLGPLWVPANRFGLKQGKKIRNIDDCSRYGTNACYHSREKLSLGGLDEILNIVKVWANAVGEDRNFSVPSAKATARRGVLHHEWSLAEARRLV